MSSPLSSKVRCWFHHLPSSFQSTSHCIDPITTKKLLVPGDALLPRHKPSPCELTHFLMIVTRKLQAAVKMWRSRLWRGFPSSPGFRNTTRNLSATQLKYTIVIFIFNITKHHWHQQHCQPHHHHCQQAKFLFYLLPQKLYDVKCTGKRRCRTQSQE